MQGREPHLRHGEELTLERLLPCERAFVHRLRGSEAVRTRLRDLGFREGVCVLMIKQAPLADPIEFRVLGAHVSLRRTEARLIDVRDPQPVAPGTCRTERGEEPCERWFDRIRRWGQRPGRRGGPGPGRGEGRGGRRRAGPHRGG
ncbi:MAG: hypothetical protein GF330_06450, partial [Candidatus Eisenbacteria bacterium]|nr:hypothetical protein [Candidatus Eisenbacteria bacterium]